MKAHVEFTDLIEGKIQLLDMTGQGELFPVVKDG